MTLAGAAGLVGVLTILAAYAAVQLRRLDATGAVNLSMNFGGASLIVVSLLEHFNLSAFLMEGAWAVVSALGLLRLAFMRRRGR